MPLRSIFHVSPEIAMPSPVAGSAVLGLCSKLHFGTWFGIAQRWHGYVAANKTRRMKHLVSVFCGCLCRPQNLPPSTPFVSALALGPANESIHSSLGHSLSPPDPMPSSVPPSATLDAQASGSEESGQEGSSITPSKAASALPSSSSSSFMSFDTLSCEAFYDPGSRTVPFAYPPKKEKLISCT